MKKGKYKPNLCFTQKPYNNVFTFKDKFEIDLES